MLDEGRADDSATGYAFGLVCERWSLLLIRELLAGPKRFSDLRRGLPEISANVLAQRLRRLLAAGVLERYTLPPPAASQVYALTDWGMRLGPVIERLERWGRQSPTHERPAEPV